MPYFDFFKSVSQLVDDALNSATEAETKISEAAESFERAINVTSGLKDSPSDDPVANQKQVGAVTKEMAKANTNDTSGVLVADALKGSLYPKVVCVSYCCTLYG
jgi:hypothetical protein